MYTVGVAAAPPPLVLVFAAAPPVTDTASTASTRNRPALRPRVELSRFLMASFPRLPRDAARRRFESRAPALPCERDHANTRLAGARTGEGPRVAAFPGARWRRSI